MFKNLCTYCNIRLPYFFPTVNRHRKPNNTSYRIILTIPTKLTDFTFGSLNISIHEYNSYNSRHNSYDAAQVLQRSINVTDPSPARYTHPATSLRAAAPQVSYNTSLTSLHSKFTESRICVRIRVVCSPESFEV